MAEIAYLQVTRACNQSCSFCSSPVNDRELDFASACRAVADFRQRGFSGIILTGGEPTIYPRLAELIRCCCSRELQPRIITNGQQLAVPGYLESLVAAGLEIIHLSYQSCRETVHDNLTGNPGSWQKCEQALARMGKLGLSPAINTVINSCNAGHLDETVAWITSHYPFVQHFVWNNLDPDQERVDKNRSLIPTFREIELPLARAARLLIRKHCTFRIERLPLCYMAEFAELSTETRKIVKGEAREIIFLDERSHFRQEKFYYGKPDVCSICRLNAICAGVYGGERFYSYAEIFPVFVEPEPVIAAIRK